MSKPDNSTNKNQNLNNQFENTQPKPKPKGKGKGKQGHKKPKGDPKRPPQMKDDHEVAGNHPKYKFNDITWWNKNKALMEDVANFTYAQVQGLPVSMRSDDDAVDVPNVTVEPMVIPGICKINLFPTGGITNNANSAINNASRLLYSWIRHANSGSRNYESADLMVMALSMSGIYSWYHELVRLYGLFTIYSKMNRYIIKPLIETLGYDFEDIQKNLALLRAHINYIAARVNAIATPKLFSIYDRYSYMPLHVFKDSENDKAQLYLFQYTHYWTFDGTTYDTGSALIPEPAPTFGNSGVTYEGICNFTEYLINLLLSNEDIGLMSGDILKAFGESGIRTLVGITPDYATIPVFDKGILEQIHNMDVFGNVLVDVENKQGVIYQSNNNLFNSLQSAETISSETQALAPLISSLIDSGYDTPDAEFNMEVTRLKFGFTTDSESSRFQITSCGVDIVTSLSIYTLNTDGSIGRSSGLSNISRVSRSSDSSLQQDLSEFILDLVKFDWHPMVTIYYYNSTLATVKVSVFGELFNYTTISNLLMSRLHDVALLSVFDVSNLFNHNV